MPAGILPAGPASRPQAHVTPFPAPRDTAAAALVLFFVKFLLDISQNAVFRESAAKNVIRIISVLNAYYRRITKIMRIVCVLFPQGLT